MLQLRTELLEHFPATLALIGLVVLVSSLLSGWVERTGLPQVAIFLLLGVVLGPFGLGLLTLTLRSPSLQVIATLALVLVLFSDAIGVDIGAAGKNRRVSGVGSGLRVNFLSSGKTRNLIRSCGAIRSDDHASYQI